MKLRIIFKERYQSLKKNFDKRSNLDKFLIKGGTLVIIYYILRLVFKNTSLLRPVFVLSKKALTALLLKSSYFITKGFGEEVSIYKNIIWIEGSQGVRIINDCLGWSLMALFAGFILIYPGNRISKYWYIPLGLFIIQLLNLGRITGMVYISRYAPEFLDIYHIYIFKIILFLVVFILWIVWIRKYGIKNTKKAGIS